MEIKKVMAGTLAALTAGATMALGIFAAGLGDFVTTGTVGGYNALTSPVIVVGNAVDSTDTLAAADIAAAVAGFATTSVSSGTGASVGVSNGADVSTADNKLYMGSVITKAKSTLTNSDLPSILASGSLTAASNTYLYDQYLVLGTGGSNVVKYNIVSEANELDPIVYLSAGSGSTGANTDPIYNMTVVFNKPVNISNADVQAQTLNLFGSVYTISSTSGATNAGYNPLVLFGYGTASDVTHGVEKQVTVGGTTYTVKALINTNQQVLVYVNGVSDSSWRSTGASTVVNGLNIYVKGVGYISSTDLTQNFAQLSFGSQQITLTDGSAVTLGTSTTVDGTLVDIIGDATGISSLTISVAATESATGYIKAGASKADPVFGSVKVAFNGLTPAPSDTARDTITATAGTTQATVAFTDYRGRAKTMNWALNSGTSNVALNASVNQAIVVRENATVNQNDYFVFAPSQESEFGHIYRLSSVSGINGATPKFTLEDAVAATSTTYDLTTAGAKTIYLDGQAVYAKNLSASSMTFSWGAGASAGAWGDKVTTFPLIKLKNGEYMTFVNNLTLVNATTYELPGNGSANLTTAALSDGFEVVTAGRISYGFQTSGSGFKLVNITTSSGSLLVDEFPAIIVMEEQSNSTAKNYITFEAYERDSTSNYVGIEPPVLSDGTSLTSAWASNTYMVSAVDLFGTYVTKLAPASSGQTVTIYYPDTQAVATVGIGADPTFSVGTSGTVQQAVKIQSPVAKFASEVSSTAPGADVIIVGGPCANTLAATVLAGQNITCSNWNFTEGIIKQVTGAFTDGKKALVVAGTEAADTRALAKKVMEGTMSYSV